MKKLLKYIIAFLFILMAIYPLKNIDSPIDLINILFLNIDKYKDYSLNSFSPQFFIFFALICCQLLLDLFSNLHNYKGFIQFLLIREGKLKIINSIFKKLIAKSFFDFLILSGILLVTAIFISKCVALNIVISIYLLRLFSIFDILISNYILGQFLDVRVKEGHYCLIFLLILLIDILFSKHLITFSNNINYELSSLFITIAIGILEYLLIIFNIKKGEF